LFFAFFFTTFAIRQGKEKEFKRITVLGSIATYSFNYDTATKLEQAVGYLWTRNYNLIIAATGSSLIGPRVIAERYHRAPPGPLVIGLGNAPTDKHYWYQVSTNSYLCHYFFERREFYSGKCLQNILQEQFSP